MNVKNIIIIACVSAVSAGAGAFAFSRFFNERHVNSVGVVNKTPAVYTSSVNSGGYPTDFVVAAESSVNAVVHVKTVYENKVSVHSDPLFDFFFGERRNIQSQPRMGTGSGVIISEDGYIVTNNHVIDNSDKITVTLNDKRTFDAKLIGTDPSTDLALLKIEASGLPIMNIGNSDDLKVGEWVLAVGNPFNLTSTVTAGIVSAKARNINILSADMKIESFIQTDAAVNPGNSGGALVNVRGELVGINTAIASQTGSYAGYAFAVPASIMSKVVSDIKKYGVVQRALLGVMISDITDEFAKEKGIKVLDGVYVAGVNANSAASAAGIKEGDIILRVNDNHVKSVSELQEQISKFSPGNKVRISVLRDNKEKDFDVVLRNQMGNTEIVVDSNPNLSVLGATLEPVSDKVKDYYGISGGLEVVDVKKGGKFYDNKVPKGLIIIKVNDYDVSCAEDIENVLRKNRSQKGKFKQNALFITGIYDDQLVYFAINLK